MGKIVVNNVYKIFGPDPASVLARTQEGAGKTEILEQTGHVVGIRDVSLQVERGETFVIMGLSGSGKSTLIRHFNRLIEPTAGQILIDGEDILRLNAKQLRELRRSKISMVFHRFGLLPHKTVLDNVASGLDIRGVGKDRAREQAREQIDIVGLGGFEDRYPQQLSGGMQQRVGLARALATDAEILLMDEAFSALDPLIRNDMQQQLIELQRRLHKTIVFITHDLDEALRLGDHIAILKDGELRQTGTPDEILLDPADDYVSRFVKDVNRGRVVNVGSLAADVPVMRADEVSTESINRIVAESAHGVAYVVDDGGRPLGAITAGMLADNPSVADESPANVAQLHPVASVSRASVVEEMLPLVASNDVPVAVVDDTGRCVGSVSREAAIGALTRPDSGA